ncbi:MULTISPECIES: type II toxin-antitoxin system PemK/MazF family toxin [unclassified Cyanobium]|uniref:type II toxin-antitoxin system PemK/MazF family toxin n=1 Tax=unclassified Cyanobium TaxID=2627006 RepID=UPI0020CC82CC|nr:MULTISPECIES: type II toxin-antitoxin system PemK/MazF family toxin [unclassified Cyanobium]
MAAEHPGLERVGLFGSYGRGDAGVGSDLDLLLIDTSSSGPQHQRLLAWPLAELLASGSAMAAALQRDSRWLWHRFGNPAVPPREGRAQAALRLAAEALARDAGACAEAREMATDFLMAENEALRVLIPARDRLLRECWAMAEQTRALDRNRIGDGPLSRLSAAEMTALEQALRAALGLAGV